MICFVKLKTKNCTAVACAADKRVETSRIYIYFIYHVPHSQFLMSLIDELVFLSHTDVSCSAGELVAAVAAVLPVQLCAL